MPRRSSLKAREEAAFVCATPLFSPISQKSGELEVLKKERKERSRGRVKEMRIRIPFFLSLSEHPVAGLGFLKKTD